MSVSAACSRENALRLNRNRQKELYKSLRVVIRRLAKIWLLGKIRSFDSVHPQRKCAGTRVRVNYSTLMNKRIPLGFAVITYDFEEPVKPVMVLFLY